MRIRTCAATALLTGVLALAGGSAAHAADPIPSPAGIAGRIPLSINVPINTCGIAVLHPTLGYVCTDLTDLL